MEGLKKIVQPKIKIMSFTHPHVIPNMADLL